jgi:hypothetical protein
MLRGVTRELMRDLGLRGEAQQLETVGAQRTR